MKWFHNAFVKQTSLSTNRERRRHSVQWHHHKEKREREREREKIQNKRREVRGRRVARASVGRLRVPIFLLGVPTARGVARRGRESGVRRAQQLTVLVLLRGAVRRARRQQHERSE